jgi:hypothetical protein
VDLPQALYDELRALADAPPKLSIAEYIRRVVAHYTAFDYPNRQSRKTANRTISGDRKHKPGPTPGTTRKADTTAWES